MSQKLSVDQSFQKFLSNLEPTDKQQQKIRITRDTIDSALANDDRIFLHPPTQPSFLTGSYARNTIIRPIDDIDMYVRVHYGKHAEDKSPLSILQLMADSIRKRYSRNTKIKVDQPCVVVTFWDYKFEVVPAVGYKNESDLYDIPGQGLKKWMQCYPNVPSKWLSSCNHKNNGRFIRLIKILKQWNRNNKVGLKSFHLELITERVFSAVTEINSYPQGILYWMYCVKDWVWKNDYPFILEPGKSYTYVDDYLYEKRRKLISIRNKLDYSLRESEKAWKFNIRGRSIAAKRIWRNMFGAMFPAPEPLPTKPVLVPPKVDQAVTLKNSPPLLQPSGLLSGHYRNALYDYDAQANPFPRPLGGLLSDTNSNALVDSILNPQPKPSNMLSSHISRNVLIDILTKSNDPFKK